MDSETNSSPESSGQSPFPDDDPAHRRRRGIYLLPNSFTAAALFCGFYAIVMAMGGRYDSAA
ncbi:MAG: CDP-diacylglycerol--serine O-phosphatidyltransferase, partial [Thiomonas sp. 20-64-5]